MIMNKIIGKVMVLSIIVAGLLQIFQKLFIENSLLLMNIKVGFLVIALLSAIIMVSIMSWETNKQKRNNSN